MTKVVDSHTALTKIFRPIPLLPKIPPTLVPFIKNFFECLKERNIDRMRLSAAYKRQLLTVSKPLNLVTTFAESFPDKKRAPISFIESVPGGIVAGIFEGFWDEDNRYTFLAATTFLECFKKVDLTSAFEVAKKSALASYELFSFQALICYFEAKTNRMYTLTYGGGGDVHIFRNREKKWSSLPLSFVGVQSASGKIEEIFEERVKETPTNVTVFPVSSGDLFLLASTALTPVFYPESAEEMVEDVVSGDLLTVQHAAKLIELGKDMGLEHENLSAISLKATIESLE